MAFSKHLKCLLLRTQKKFSSLRNEQWGLPGLGDSVEAVFLLWGKGHGVKPANRSSKPAASQKPI